MNLTITGKNIDITEGLRSYLSKKLEKVKDFLPHSIDIHVGMGVEKKVNHQMEITIKSEAKIFHSEFKSEDMYATIDGLIDRIVRQVRRYKEKLHDFSADRVSMALEKKKKKKPTLPLLKFEKFYLGPCPTKRLFYN